MVSNSPPVAQLLTLQRLVEIEGELSGLLTDLRATDERSPEQIERLKAIVAELTEMDCGCNCSRPAISCRVSRRAKCTRSRSGVR